MGMITSTAVAEEIMNKIKNGEYPNRNTAYRLLMEIVNQFRGERIADDAQYLIDTLYDDQKFKK